MFHRFERMMAYKYLRSKSKGFVSVVAGFSFLGIMLGVATLIIVMSVMNGFRHELLTRIVGMKGHLWVQNYGAPVSENPIITNTIKKNPHIKACVPLVEQQAVLLFKGDARGLSIQGISFEDLKNRSILFDNLKEGKWNGFNENTLWIGRRLADKLGIQVGDLVTLMTPKGTPSAFGTLPKQRSFKIGGIFEVGMIDFDTHIALMPLKKAQSFFQMEGTVTNYEVFLNDPERSYQVGLQIYHALGKHYQVIDWQHGNSSYFQAVQIERNVMFIILTLIILIAAFNIISSLIMLVKDKTRDIAILRTMGASRSSIMKIFFLTGSSIGLVGTALGVVLGLGFALNIERIRRFLESFTGTNLFSAEIYFLSQLPARVNWDEVISIVALSIFLSFSATLYPSWRSGRLDPIEGLRQ